MLDDGLLCSLGEICASAGLFAAGLVAQYPEVGGNAPGFHDARGSISLANLDERAL